jgi:DNA-binding PadR family transcriptional regulator
MTKGNNAKFVLLGLLSHEPMTGYDIKKVMSLRMSYFWDLSYGQIYPTLEALEKDGLVTKEVVIEERGPNRKVYSITEAGIEILRKWLAEPARKESHKYEILVKLFFGNQSAPDSSIKHIQEFRARNAKNLEVMTLFEENLKESLSWNNDNFYMLLTVLLGKNTFKASIEWADTAIKMLEDRTRSR